MPSRAPWPGECDIDDRLVGCRRALAAASAASSRGVAQCLGVRWRIRAAVLAVVAAAGVSLLRLSPRRRRRAFRRSGQAIQIRLDRRRPARRHSGRDLQGAAAIVPRSTCPARAGNRSASSSSRDGPAGRHIEAAQPGVRPHRAELRRLSRRDLSRNPRRARRSWSPACRPTLDLGRFAKFLTDCALDERFNPWQVVQAAERAGAQIPDRPAAAAICGGAGDARGADPGALQVPLSGPRGDAGSRPLRYVRAGEGAA